MIGKNAISNKIVSFVLVVAFLVTLVIPSQVFATDVEKCDSCSVTTKPTLIASHYDNEGNLIQRYDTGAEVIHYTNGNIVLNDYTHLFSDEIPSVQTRSIGTVIAIVSFVLFSCDVVELIDPKHRNPCHLVIDYIYNGTGGPPDGKYKVYATYVPGYIPGCEPRYSSPCNAGYYKYSLSKIG